MSLEADPAGNPGTELGWESSSPFDDLDLMCSLESFREPNLPFESFSFVSASDDGVFFGFTSVTAVYIFLLDTGTEDSVA